MEKTELIKVFNTIYEAVDESKCGPIFGENDGKRALNQIGYNTLMYSISSLLPKNMNMDFKEKFGGEDWKK